MKILVVQIGKNGDLILCTPMFRALKAGLESCDLHVLAATRNHDVLRDQKLVSTVHVYNKNVADMYRLFVTLGSEKYDLLIDPKDHYSRESSFVARTVKAAMSIGFNPPTKNTYTHAVPGDEFNNSQSPPLHAVERNLQALKFLDIASTNLRPKLEVIPAARDAVMGKTGAAPENVSSIVINISAGQDVRRWSDDQWKALCHGIRTKHVRLLILAAPPDHASALRIAASFEKGVQAVPTNSIHEGIALVQMADMLVSTDSAMIHVASAFNTPCVGLYSSVDWNFYKFRPLSTLHATVRPQLTGGEVEDIVVDEVIKATRDLLQKLITQRATT